LEAVGLELAFDAVAGTAAAGSFRIPALNHEVLDNAVENNAVIEMFLDQADEVVDGFGSNIRIKLRFHDAAVFHSDSYDRIFLCHHKYPQPGIRAVVSFLFMLVSIVMEKFWEVKR
jgi:hypothetical protein